MLDTIEKYKQWNNALFKKFFPQGQEDAVLYIDDSIVEEVGKNICNPENGNEWGEKFLSATLVSNETFLKIINPRPTEDALNSLIIGDVSKILKAKTWENLLENLQHFKFRDKNYPAYPAYFGLLCAIIYIASKKGINHRNISSECAKYLGTKESKLGKKINIFFQKLHEDVPSFNANRMICGEQSNMSRLKFHIILKKENREEFTRFLEVNDLKWEEYETYESYINNILVPALDQAKKTELIKFVTQWENSPYVKHILRCGLNFGRSQSNDDTIPKKNIDWKYAINFGPMGDASLFIVCNNIDTPFNIYYENETLSVDVNSSFEEIIARNLNGIKEINDIEYDHYLIRNISKNRWNTLYFQKITDDYYKQVHENECIPNNEYIILCKTKLEEKEPFDKIGGYFAYEEKYCKKHQKNNKLNQTIIDKYKFHRLGSWCSIYISSYHYLCWQPDKIGAKEEIITKFLKGKDGRTYFHLTPNKNMLIGNLNIKDEKGEIILSERVSYEIKWDGNKNSYHLNGWGEASTEESCLCDGRITRKQNIECDLIGNSINGSEILLQILYDFADENGCVTQRRMRAAIDFAFSFHGIISTENQAEIKSVIYALKSLGYIITHYDVNQREYIYQLCPKYLEKTDYRYYIGYSGDNLSLVKGVYSKESLNKLLNKYTYTFKKRPYEKEDNKEYACLPDMYLIADLKNTGHNDWKEIKHQISEPMIQFAKSMTEFDKVFLNNGDRYIETIPIDAPCLLSDHNGYFLCDKSSEGEYRKYKYYRNRTNNIQRLIPKSNIKLYIQNAKGLPICIFGWDICNNRPNFAEISFLWNMGLPRILEIALCDSNIGLPKIESVFIVDQKELDVSSKTVICKIRKYSTNATNENHSTIQSAVEKMCGVTDKEKENAKIDISNKRLYFSKKVSNFEIRHVRHYNFKYDLFALYNKNILLGDQLRAFAIGKRIFLRNDDNKYQKIKSDNVNEVFSNIIKNNSRQEIVWENFFENKPNIEEYEKINIIERQQNNI